MASVTLALAWRASAAVSAIDAPDASASATKLLAG
jgi:hypothetical protein